MPAVEKDEWDGFYSMCEEAAEAMAEFINGGSSPAIRPVVLPPI